MRWSGLIRKPEFITIWLKCLDDAPTNAPHFGCGEAPLGSEFLPNLLNVVDLGDGKTGIIVNITGEDSAEIDLMEYRDGVDTKRMRVLQSIASGE